METLNTLAARVQPKRVERFLEELLNLRTNDAKALERFAKKFDDMLPKNILFAKEAYAPLVVGGDPSLRVNVLLKARRFLAEAWRAPTMLAREISVLRLIGSYLQTNDEPRGVDRSLVSYNQEYWAEEAISNVDAFFLVLLRALHTLDRMRFCPNPECLTPYFIARKRRQKYCSEVCAGAAQRELKRIWWAEHGDAWREARKRRAKKIPKTSAKEFHPKRRKRHGTL
ncbi:MAG TPA: hypothetical protein VG204_00240 [Terriglobia bacterium]|nr:hypothetical protein [Terriglobia bacterium]